MIIWLSSYPRSGNTFLRTLLKSCFGQYTYSVYNDNEIGSDPGLSEVTGHRALDHSIGSAGFDLGEMRDSDEIYFLKTHEPNRSLVETNDKVIYIIRDGRNATFSLHKYLHDFHDIDVSPLELSVGLDFPKSSWSDHVAGWNPKESDDTLLLYFEEIIKNPKETVDQIAAFSGIQPTGYHVPEFETLQKIDSRFFRGGQKKAASQAIPTEADAYFWIRSFRQMRDYGYLENKPDFLKGLSEEDLLTLQKGTGRAAVYSRRICSDLSARVQHGNSRITGLQKENDLQRDELQKRETRINLQSEELQKREKRISEQDTRINLQRDELQKREKRIGEQDTRINRQCGELAKKDIQIGQQIDKLRQAGEQNKKLRKDLQEKRNTINLILESRSWKLTSPLRRIRSFLTKA